MINMHSGDPTLEIKLSSVRDNYLALKLIAASSEVGAAVKADAYGLGSNYIAPVLQQAGCKHFFVANLDEGLSIRKILGQSAFIYILNGVFFDTAQELIANNLIPVINHPGQFELWQNSARNLQQKLPAVIHLNTGMNRLGLSQLDFTKLIDNLDSFECLDVKFIMSHFASSDEPENPDNHLQLVLFNELTAKLPGVKRSICNSGGIFLNEKAHFDIVRPGAALYGLITHPAAGKHLKNPVSLYAPIIQIHELKTGDKIGYNGTYVAKSNMRTATIPIGYADGYMRAFSSRGCMYIGAYEVPVVGRVSMDLVTVDISNLPVEDCFVGQKVELIGQHRTPDDLARVAGTIGYEIITSLGKRYKRVYT